MSPRLFLYALIFVGFLIRLIFALTHDNHLGVDGGAYILGLRQLLGSDVPGGFSRPPLAPGLQLWPFISLFGDDNGYKIWAAIAATTPIPAVYMLGRLFLTKWQSIFAAGFVSLDMLHAEMFVTGALPLEGFSLIAVGIWAITKIARFENDYKEIVILALVVPLIAHVNHTSAGIALLVFPTYMMALSGFYPAKQIDLKPGIPALNWPFRILTTPISQFPAVGALIIGSLLALTALPYYLDVKPFGGMLDYPGSWIYFTYFPDSSWFQLIISAPLAFWAMRYGDNHVIKAFGALVTLQAVLGVFISTDETIINIFYRSRYLLAFWFYPVIAWVVFKYWWKPVTSISRPLAFAAMFLFVGLTGWEWYNSIHGQAKYSDMVTVETEQAIKIINKDNQANEGIISSAFTMSLWVSALTEVESPHPWTWQPPKRWRESDVQVRCVLGWVKDCDPVLSAKVLGVRYILIDTIHPYYNGRAPGYYGQPDKQPWSHTENANWLTLKFDKGHTKLWKVN
tara:strand:- start:4037 stop:5569 length:1533 start_codon:yes stop_codon:yes gene_type:complete